jgi:hypothetical protein
MVYNDLNRSDTYKLHLSYPSAEKAFENLSMPGCLCSSHFENDEPLDDSY